jgi:Fic-DOC domain mobile mystery protein B
MLLGPAIPGETPIDDISGLKVKGITLRQELNEVEAKNILKATLKYLGGRLNRRSAPFHLVWSLRLHKEMFGDVWRWAGKRREKAVNLGVAPEQIEPRLYDLLKNLSCWTNLPLVEQAARLHHQAVQIHPFNNGNGRWSRLLANIRLRLHKSPLTRWPEEAVSDGQSPIRAEYLTAIRAADEGDYEALVGLHAKYTQPEAERD